MRRSTSDKTDKKLQFGDHRISVGGYPFCQKVTNPTKQQPKFGHGLTSLPPPSGRGWTRGSSDMSGPPSPMAKDSSGQVKATTKKRKIRTSGDENQVPPGDLQTDDRHCTIALDPGVRTFMTDYEQMGLSPLTLLTHTTRASGLIGHWPWGFTPGPSGLAELVRIVHKVQLL